MPEKIPPEQIPAVERSRLNDQGLEKLSEEERRAWQLLVPAYKKGAIQLELCKDYDRQVVRRDLKLIEEKKRTFAKEHSPEQAVFQRRAELLEALLNEQINAPTTKWLGENSESMIASEYDDIFNGIDLIVEISQEVGLRHLALSIDITSSSIHLFEKLSEIKDNIRKGYLSKVKYFRSKSMQPRFMRELSNIPKVVVGVDARTIRNLSLLRVEYYSAKKGAKLEQNSPDIRKALAKKANQILHKIAKYRTQMLILEEIELQLKTFVEFARQNHQEKTGR